MIVAPRTGMSVPVVPMTTRNMLPYTWEDMLLRSSAKSSMSEDVRHISVKQNRTLVLRRYSPKPTDTDERKAVRYRIQEPRIHVDTQHDNQPTYTRSYEPRDISQQLVFLTTPRQIDSTARPHRIGYRQIDHSKIKMRQQLPRVCMIDSHLRIGVKEFFFKAVHSHLSSAGGAEAHEGDSHVLPSPPTCHKEAFYLRQRVSP